MEVTFKDYPVEAWYTGLPPDKQKTVYQTMVDNPSHYSEVDINFDNKTWRVTFSKKGDKIRIESVVQR